MLIRDSLLADYDRELGTTRKLLERLADDRLTWRPHDKSMTLGGLATHLSNIPNWGRIMLTTERFDLAEAPPNLEPKTSRAEILRLFDESGRQTRALMDRTDAEYLAPWVVAREGQEMFSVPKVAAFRTWVIHHMIHHRGQLSVYLRLNDVPVPSIYGPSADES